MADETTATIETAPADAPATEGVVSEWSLMNADQKLSYINGLREQAGVTPGEPRERDEKGRFVPTKQEETPGEGDAHSVPADAGSTATPEQAKPKTEEPPDWRDAEVQGLAAAYGIKADKLAKIPSREVLDILLEGLDRRDQQPQAAETEKKPAAKQGQQKSQTSDLLAELEAFALDDDEMLVSQDGPRIVKAFKGVAEEIKQLRAWKQEQDQAAGRQWIKEAQSRVVESLQKISPELYGEPGKPPTTEQAKFINEAWNEHYERSAFLESKGGKPDESLAFVKRAAYAVHGDRLSEKIDEKQKRLDKLVAQSSRRTGGGSRDSLPSPGATPLEKNLAKLPQTLRSLGVAGT